MISDAELNIFYCIFPTVKENKVGYMLFAKILCGFIVGNKQWIDESFGPKSKRFPMPGMVGPSFNMKPDIQKMDYVPPVNVCI